MDVTETDQAHVRADVAHEFCKDDYILVVKADKKKNQWCW